MGARGPKPGFKQARAEAAAAVVASTAALAVLPVFRPYAELSTAQRENPGLLEGNDLKALAHRWGMAKSDLATLSDVRIREQLRYITQTRMEEG